MHTPSWFGRWCHWLFRPLIPPFLPLGQTIGVISNGCCLCATAVAAASSDPHPPRADFFFFFSVAATLKVVCKMNVADKMFQRPPAKGVHVQLSHGRTCAHHLAVPLLCQGPVQPHQTSQPLRHGVPSLTLPVS